ncbi:MAG: YggS family pyridoxal phosphate-dependent enzyme [Turicibacter sp.]|nr:YggS family pyridoxal phosphate-dependent enzyme [Turicibacter sp.]
MSVLANVRQVQRNIEAAASVAKRNPKEITIIGVTKYGDAEAAKELVASGITHLGENRADAFLEKHAAIGSEATWHFIGTLQTRKVRDIINQVDYLHSLDRLSLAEEIQKRAMRTIKCFIQVNVAQEPNKQGLAPCEVLSFARQVSHLDKIEVVGLMTMAPLTADERVLRDCFATLKGLQQQVQNLSLTNIPCTELSMGMTNDYRIAIAEGATFLRLGRCLTQN